MKKLLKLFIVMLAVCGISCDQLGGLFGGGNNNENDDNGGNGGGTTESLFTITVTDITSGSAYVAVETSSNETYYFDVIEKEYFDQYADKMVFATEYVADVKAMYEKYDYTLADALSVGNDGYQYREGDLTADTDYYAFAFCVTEEGVVTSDVTLKPFKTLEAAPVVPSDNTFEVSVTNITATSATVSVVPSNNDTYYFDVIEKEYFDLYTDKKEFATELVADVKAMYEGYGYTLADALSLGNDDVTYEGESALDPNTEYYAFAFGVSSSGTITTEVTVKAFTTLASGSGNEGGNTGGSNSGDKNLSCYVFGYYENYGDWYETGATNWYIDLYSETTNDYFVLELQGNLSEAAPVAGEYKLLSSFDAGTAVAGGVYEGYPYGTYWALLNDSWDDYVEYALCISGTVKIGKSGDDYTINIDAVDEYGNSIKMSYAGVLEEWVEEYSLSAQRLSNNLNKRFCTVSRMMKQKQSKMVQKVANKPVKLAPKKAIVVKPLVKTLVKKSVK